MNGEGTHDGATLSGTAACRVYYLAYHGPEEAELSLWTQFMQEAASELRRTTLLRGWVNRGNQKGPEQLRPGPYAATLWVG